MSDYRPIWLTAVPASPLAYLLRLAIFTGLYFLGAMLGLYLETGYGGVTPIWPPAGLAVSVMLLSGTRYWPMVLVGETLVALHLGQPLAAGIIGGAAQILEAFLALLLLGRHGGRQIVSSGLSVLRFALFGAILPPLLSAAIGAASLWSLGHLAGGEVLSGFVTWWLGDAVGILVLTPMLIGGATRPVPRRGFLLGCLVFTILLAVLCVSIVVFGSERAYALLFVLIPFVVVAAIRFRMLGASAAILLMMFIVFRMRPEDLAQGDFITTIRMTFVGTCAFTGYLVAGFMASRQQRVNQIGRQKEYLQTLNDLMVGLVSRLDRDRLLDDLVTRACTLMGAESGCFLQKSTETGETMATIGKGIYEGMDGYRVSPGKGLAGSVYASNQPMIINDYQNWAGRHPDPLWDPVVSIIGVPIQHAEETVGVLEVVRTSRNRPFGQDDLEVLQQFGKLASVAWSNATLYEDLAHQLQAREKAEKALVISERTHRELFNAAGAAICVLDPNSGAIQNANTAAEKLLAPEPVVGRSFFRLLPGKDPEFSEEEGMALLRRCSEQGEQVREWQAVLPNGQTMWLEIVLSEALIDDQARVLAVVRDIDARKEVEKVQNNLAQNQKMEAMGTLAGGVAHDFNNILAAIIGFTELALEYDLPPDHQAVESLRQVLEAGKRASDLVKQILAFSRPSEVELRSVDVRAVTEEVVSLVSASQPPTVEILTQTAVSNSHVRSTSTHIHQVLMNLVTNAAQALPEKRGQIEVHLANTVLREAAHPSGLEQLKDGEYLMITVRDTGCGMDRSTVEKVFEPYFTTKGPEQGTGLGLSVVHGIVARLDGAVRVESEVGSGTTVTVLLPVVAVSQEDSAREAAQLPGGQESILFVDDNPLLTDLAARFLDKLGYRVSVFQSSQVALEYFSKDPRAFDLVISDLWMPELTGVELCRAIRASRPEIPILICTGNPENISAEEAQELAISGLAHKPLVLRQFANLIREALALEV